MINNSKFAERLKKVMDYYQLSSSSFADKIEVQRSSISHLLSGRNKPSLDFVLKVLDTFNTVDLYWLLNGKGSFPKKEDSFTPIQQKSVTSVAAIYPEKGTANSKEIDRIIIFYKDGTFENYIP